MEINTEYTLDNLPEDWDMVVSTREKRGSTRYTLRYKHVWSVSHTDDEENYKEKLLQGLRNPHQRLVPLFKEAGLFNDDWFKMERGWSYMQQCLKLGYVDGNKAMTLFPYPSTRRWLDAHNISYDDSLSRRWDVLHPPKDPITVVLDGNTYIKKDTTWYRIDGLKELPLQRKTTFRSTWDVRVAYAKGAIDMDEVASFNWGTVLEVIGDQVFLLFENAEVLPSLEDFNNLKTNVFNTVFRLLRLESDPAACPLCGFKLQAGLYCPVYKYDRVVGPKRKQFLDLVDKILKREISGHLGHLIFTGASPNTRRTEATRWNTRKVPFVPYFLQRHKRLESCPNLESARNYVQKNLLDLMAIGLRPKEATVTSFMYGGNRYGLHIGAGTVFTMIKDDEQYIPVAFRKWSKEKQMEFLKTDDESLYEAYRKRIRGFFRHYYALKAEGVRARTAWLIAQDAHLKLQFDFVARKRAGSMWICLGVNKTAKVHEFPQPVYRGGVA